MFLLSFAFAQFTPLDQPTFDERIDIGDYSLRTTCYGEGAPTVIIEAGFGDTPVHWGGWSHVIEGVVGTTQICTYDRLGLGFGQPIPVEVERRTSQDSVADLNKLLAAADIEGPYILVGHSWGGINIRLYADQYPEDVLGIVLVDAAHPQQLEAFKKGIPPELPDDSEELKRAKRDLRSLPGLSNPEKLDFLASLELAQKLADLGDLPLVVLTQSSTSDLPPDMPLEVADLAAQIWQALQTDLATLSTNSKHVIATKAGHYIHEEEPQLVIDAILHVLSEAEK